MTSILAPGVGYSTFRQLFQPRDDQRIRLTIPDYQRAYDWRTEQRADLFGDLERLAELAEAGRLDERGGHFCGTVICTPGAHETDELHYDVVDGQQRLTTLVLLHSRLAAACGLDPFIVSPPKAFFLPQSADRDFFVGIANRRYQSSADSAGQGHYESAAEEIDGWIETLGGAGKRRAMLDLIEERLQFIFFVLPDGKEVSKVFETINNRGKPLTQLDLVKNHLIYVQSVHGWGGEVDRIWSRIQQLALKTRFRERESVDTVLRAVVTAMFKPGRRNAGETDHKIIKEHIRGPDDGETFDRFLRFLVSGFQSFHDLRGAWTTGRDADVGTQLTYLNLHPSISGVLPLIFARQFFRNGELGADVLAAIEKANFRLYGLMNAAKRSNSYHVALHNLAHEYFIDQCRAVSHTTPQRKREISVGLIESLTRTVTGYHKDGFVQIVRALTLDDDDGTDFHEWEALRYFLARWEESLRNKQSFEYGRLSRRYRDSHSNDYLAREHIYPASTKGPIADYRDRLQLRRLGNFMLLPQGVNSSLSNKAPGEKIEALAGADQDNALLVQNAQLAGYLEQAGTFVRTLEARTNEAFGSERQGRFNVSLR